MGNQQAPGVPRAEGVLVLVEQQWEVELPEQLGPEEQRLVLEPVELSAGQQQEWARNQRR